MSNALAWGPELGDTRFWNVVVEDFFFGYDGDTEGRAAVSGELRLSNFPLCKRVDTEWASAIVHGDARFVNGSHTYPYLVGYLLRDKAKSFKKDNGSHVLEVDKDINHPSITKQRIDFVKLFATLRAVSKGLGQRPATGKTAFNGGSIAFDDPNNIGDAVFEVDIPTLNKSTEIVFNARKAKRILVNVRSAGTAHGVLTGGFMNSGTPPTHTVPGDADRILINFLDPQTIHMNHIQVHGSILAPDSAFTCWEGHLLGVFIAKSYTSWEKRNFQFDWSYTWAADPDTEAILAKMIDEQQAKVNEGRQRLFADLKLAGM